MSVKFHTFLLDHTFCSVEFETSKHSPIQCCFQVLIMIPFWLAKNDDIISDSNDPGKALEYLIDSLLEHILWGYGAKGKPFKAETTKRSIMSSEELRFLVEDYVPISTFGVEYSEPFGICELWRHIIQCRHVIMLAFNPLRVDYTLAVPLAGLSENAQNSKKKKTGGGGVGWRSPHGPWPEIWLFYLPISENPRKWIFQAQQFSHYWLMGWRYLPLTGGAGVGICGDWTWLASVGRPVW